MSQTRREFLAVAAAGTATALAPAVTAADPTAALTVVVTDPLAAPLSCPCVKGYAQRDYEKLGKYLEGKIGRPVRVTFAETLSAALLKKTDGKADLVIGKDSVVRAEAKANKLAVTRLAALSGKDGSTTQTGLIVVAKDDPATSAGQLKGYRIILGPAEAEEKHAAALAVLTDLGVEVGGTPETCTACSDGATKVIELQKAGEKAATVISSYAQPLLEGCGTIKKGDLRVIGETDPVPFIAAFATAALAEPEREAVRAALLAVGTEAALCTALETKAGFVTPPAAGAKKK